MVKRYTLSQLEVQDQVTRGRREISQYFTRVAEREIIRVYVRRLTCFHSCYGRKHPASARRFSTPTAAASHDQQWVTNGIPERCCRKTRYCSPHIGCRLSRHACFSFIPESRTRLITACIYRRSVMFGWIYEYRVGANGGVCEWDYNQPIW